MYKKAMQKLINVTDLSEITGLAVDTLYRWVAQKRVPYVKVGRLTKFDITAIDEWIKDMSVSCKDY